MHAAACAARCAETPGMQRARSHACVPPSCPTVSTLCLSSSRRQRQALWLSTEAVALQRARACGPCARRRARPVQQKNHVTYLLRRGRRHPCKSSLRSGARLPEARARPKACSVTNERAIGLAIGCEREKRTTRRQDARAAVASAWRTLWERATKLGRLELVEHRDQPRTPSLGCR